MREVGKSFRQRQGIRERIEETMNDKTNAKAGSGGIRKVRMLKGLKVKTRIKAGGLRMQHSERMMRDSAGASALTARVKVSIRPGGPSLRTRGCE